MFVDLVCTQVHPEALMFDIHGQLYILVNRLRRRREFLSKDVQGSVTADES